MPQARDSLRDQWRSDENAITYLKQRGYKLTNKWNFLKPEKIITPTNLDRSAEEYMSEEWDFGNIVASLSEGEFVNE